MFNVGDRVVCTAGRNKDYVGTTGEVVGEDSDYIHVLPDQESRNKVGLIHSSGVWAFTKRLYTLELEQADNFVDEWL